MIKIKPCLSKAEKCYIYSQRIKEIENETRKRKASS